MALTVYRNVLEAPPVSPPRYSLLTAVEVVDEPGTRWEGGYEFVSEVGGRSGSDFLEQCLQWYWSGTDVPWNVAVEPMVVWAEDPCHSTLGSRGRDWQGRARRSLLAHQSHDLAKRVAVDILNPAAVTQAPVEQDVAPTHGLAQLEDRLSQALHGPVGYLHMSPGTLSILVGAGLVRLDGARWVTGIGNIVVADSGYADNLEVGGDDFGSIVATGPVRVRLGPIEVPSDPTEFIDASTNSVAVVAWRPAAVEVDLGSAGVELGAPGDFTPTALSVRILAGPPTTGTPGR